MAVSRAGMFPMDPDAIDRRLRDVSQLRRLGLSIGQTKRVGRAVPSRGQASKQPDKTRNVRSMR